ncbi:hypothetical protein [Streptomyces sp. YIM B13508]|uniref:hypothetical protein n=1 Tax=Streptomyces sp. YIM B13508 TaxID=3366315 RepID=UPI003697EACC
MADRTQAQSGWYGHCKQVLRRFLAHSGIDEGQAQAIVENAAGGRSGSWTTPDVLVADTVNSRFTGGAGRTR